MTDNKDEIVISMKIPDKLKSMEEKMEKLIRFFKDEEGATAVEYGIMVALIAMVIILAVTAIGTNLNVVFNSVSSKLPS